MSFALLNDSGRPVVVISPPACGTGSLCRAFRVNRKLHRHVPLDFFEDSIQRLWGDAEPIVIASYREPIKRLASWVALRMRQEGEEVPEEITRQLVAKYASPKEIVTPATLYDLDRVDAVIDFSSPKLLASSWADARKLADISWLPKRLPHINQRASRAGATLDEHARAWVGMKFPESEWALRAFFRLHWEKLHAPDTITKEAFEDWLGELPTGCDCIAHSRKVLEILPFNPIDPDWRTKFHDLVNVGLGRCPKGLTDWSDSVNAVRLELARKLNKDAPLIPKKCAPCGR